MTILFICEMSVQFFDCRFCVEIFQINGFFGHGHSLKRKFGQGFFVDQKRENLRDPDIRLINLGPDFDHEFYIIQNIMRVAVKFPINNQIFIKNLVDLENVQWPFDLRSTKGQFNFIIFNSFFIGASLPSYTQIVMNML